MKHFVLLLASAIAMDATASPCSGVNRDLAEGRKAQLAPVIAKQLNTDSVNILQSFRYRTWYIVYVETHATDETYLFFAADPLNARYLTTWGGGAAPSEKADVEQWVRQNAKGIPRNWHLALRSTSQRTAINEPRNFIARLDRHGLWKSLLYRARVQRRCSAQEPTVATVSFQVGCLALPAVLVACREH